MAINIGNAPCCTLNPFALDNNLSFFLFCPQSVADNAVYVHALSFALSYPFSKGSKFATLALNSSLDSWLTPLIRSLCALHKAEEADLKSHLLPYSCLFSVHVKIICGITVQHVMPGKGQPTRVAMLSNKFGSDFEHRRLVWRDGSFLSLSLLQITASTRPTTSRCIFSMQRSDTPTPAGMSPCTWGKACTWKSHRTRCKLSIWPRAMSLAHVSERIFLHNMNESLITSSLFRTLWPISL